MPQVFLTFDVHFSLTHDVLRNELLVNRRFFLFECWSWQCSVGMKKSNALKFCDSCFCFFCFTWQPLSLKLPRSRWILPPQAPRAPPKRTNRFSPVFFSFEFRQSPASANGVSSCHTFFQTLVSRLVFLRIHNLWFAALSVFRASYFGDYTAQINKYQSPPIGRVVTERQRHNTS